MESVHFCTLIPESIIRSRGAMVARLTPDQKVACSSHVGVKPLVYTVYIEKLIVKLNYLELNFTNN